MELMELNLHEHLGNTNTHQICTQWHSASAICVCVFVCESVRVTVRVKMCARACVYAFLTVCISV